MTPRAKRVRAATTLLATLVVAGLAGTALAHGPDPLVAGAAWAQDQSVSYV